MLILARVLETLLGNPRSRCLTSQRNSYTPPHVEGKLEKNHSGYLPQHFLCHMFRREQAEKLPRSFRPITSFLNSGIL